MQGNGRNKLRTYKLFKTTYVEEHYVKIIMQRNHRSTFAKFRMGLAPLRIEIGRYERLEEEQRACFNCGDTIESEENVLLECPLYQQIREQWFVKLRQHIPEFYVKTKQVKVITVGKHTPCKLSFVYTPQVKLSGY